ncbi:MAG: hypothetical protein AB7O95_22460 [Geminicoccaceae bacterium]
MNRIVFGVATIVAVLTVAFTIWFQTGQATPVAPAAAVVPARQYDTTGGQEMRPRWPSGGQSDDAAGN